MSRSLHCTVLYCTVLCLHCITRQYVRDTFAGVRQNVTVNGLDMAELDGDALDNDEGELGSPAHTTYHPSRTPYHTTHMHYTTIHTTHHLHPLTISKQTRTSRTTTAWPHASSPCRRCSRA